MGAVTSLSVLSSTNNFTLTTGTKKQFGAKNIKRETKPPDYTGYNYIRRYHGYQRLKTCKDAKCFIKTKQYSK